MTLDGDDVCTEGMGRAIRDKYQQTYMDGFRWSMKPVLMEYILVNSIADKVAFLDPDLFFYSNPDFLFCELDTYSMLVNPAWRSADPDVDKWQYLLLYTQGLYNAGFTAAAKSGLPQLRWWAKACLAYCENTPSRGLFVDQAHLNLLPVYFPSTGIIQHKGCNLASWNFYECVRTKDQHGNVRISNEFPVVFIHFTPATIKGIVKGRDGFLLPHLEEYNTTLQQAGLKKDLIAWARQAIVRDEKASRITLWKRVKGKLRSITSRR
jgi:hypothetical protein